jgi:hypothetical protein
MEALTAHPAAREAFFNAGTAYFVPPASPGELDFGAWLAERTPMGAASVAVRPPGARSPVLLPRIRQAVPSSPSRLGRRRRGSAQAVHAAYLVDIMGFSPRQLAGSGLFSFTTERGARHHLRDGRLTASDLGAWPWAVVEGKALPRNWWADRDFAFALQQWAVADLHSLPARPAVQLLRSPRYTAAARLPIA